MKRILFLMYITLLLSSCGPTIKITDYNPNLYRKKISSPDSIFPQKSIIVRTASKKGNYPFIHKNGFKTYEIIKSKTVKNKNSIFANELKFYATYSSFYTRKSMYEKFGNWNKNLYIKEERTPFLIWEKVKLFPKKDKYFYVIAAGSECTTCNVDLKNIYSSIIVLDENKNDCLTDRNPKLKKEIINFFSEGIKNLTNSNEFYEKFWGLVLKKKIKK